MAAVEAAPQRTALPDEMLLADELLEAGRPHPGGEGLTARRRTEERLGSGAVHDGGRGEGAEGMHAARL